MEIEPFSSRRRELWLDATALGTQAGEFFRSLDARGLATVVVSPEQLPSLATSVPFKIAVRPGVGEVPASLDRADIVVLDVCDLDRTPGLPAVIALYGLVTSEQDLVEFADRLQASRAAYGIVELKDETNIPLELLIAWFQKMPVKVLKRVRSGAQGSVALQTLEWGADGFVLATDDREEVASARKLIEAADSPALVLSEWEVTRVAQVGLGHRVCIDSVSLLSESEGMLVGSQANAFVLMCSETHPLPYMPLRPFRVNAGAVHSYVVAPRGRTNYLSEIESGIECLAVDSSGRTRAVTVGRAKIEVRPLLLIAFDGGDVRGTVLIQNDWHVRITGAQGEVLNVTDCRPGTKLLGWSASAARHCGIPIDEGLREQ